MNASCWVVRRDAVNAIWLLLSGSMPFALHVSGAASSPVPNSRKRRLCPYDQNGDVDTLSAFSTSTDRTTTISQAFPPRTRRAFE